MTPEIIARVDAWLATHDASVWLRADWTSRVENWRYRAGFRDDSNVDRAKALASIEAAMLGILLALVREAWGVPSLRCGHVGGWGDDWDTWHVDNPPGRGHGCCLKGEGPTEAEALVAALEAAPAQSEGVAT